MQMSSSNKTMDGKMLVQQRQLPTGAVVALSQVVAFSPFCCYWVGWWH